jgi:lysophospholipase L1-like esterase
VTALAGAFLLSACGDSPTASTPVPVDPGAPAISCPSTPTPVQSLDGLAVAVSYGTPTVTGGSVPLTGPACTPASGTAFSVGSTTVTCTVTDAKARTASCPFSVTVLSPPKLTLTRFLAFGDSMTNGEVVSEGSVKPRIVDRALAWPNDLNRDLAIRYRTQQPFVTDEGISGETSAQGAARIAGTIGGGLYQVLLLMEGANDIPGGTLSIPPAANNMQSMIRTAKAAGLAVFLATLPPENPAACMGSASFPGCIARNGGAAFVVPYNNALKVIAAAESVTLVDVYQAFNGDVTTLIDFDGLHPTPQGYQVIADTFFKSIQQNLEVKTTTSATTLARPVVPSPRRR